MVLEGGSSLLNQFLEFIRRAIELRRDAGTSWDGWDILRAREDHTVVTHGSKVRLEQNRDAPEG